MDRPYPLAGEQTRRCVTPPRADVADFLVKQIDDDDFLYKTPVLTG